MTAKGRKPAVAQWCAIQSNEENDQIASKSWTLFQRVAWARGND